MGDFLDRVGNFWEFSKGVWGTLLGQWPNRVPPKKDQNSSVWGAPYVQKCLGHAFFSKNGVGFWAKMGDFFGPQEGAVSAGICFQTKWN